MRYILIIAISLVIFLLLSREVHPPTQRLISQEKILAFGDSLTFGHGVNTEQSYPAVLAQLSGHPVINGGKSAETSAQGLRRLPDILRDSDVKVMILCYGGNDILQRRSREALRENLIDMITMAKSRDIQILLIGVPDISLVGLSALPLYKEIAKEEEIPYIETMLEDILSDSSLKGDRIHPNARGYHKMAEEIYQALLKYGIL